MKLYYAHNEYFADIYENFKNSIKDPWEIMEYKIDDFKAKNIVAGGSEGDAMRNNLLQEAFKTTKENEIFVMCDIDILFYRPCIEMIKREFAKKQLVEINGKTIEKDIDLIFQKENCNERWEGMGVNMGFMAIRNNKKNKDLFDRLYSEVFDKKLWDQPTLNKFLYDNMKPGVSRITSSPKDSNNVAHYLNNEDVVWDTFCPEVWNYSIGLNYLNENIYLHHANCAITKEEKFNQFKKVKKIMSGYKSNTIKDLHIQSQRLIELFKEHSIALDHIAGPREGAFDSYSPVLGAFIETLSYINSLIDREPNKTIKILQIGFNAGHSTILLTSIFPDAEITSIDIGEHGYVIPCNNYILKNINNTHRLIIENSITCMANLDDKFDIIFIDGGHVNDVPYFDLFQSKKLSTKNTWIIMNDVCNAFYGSEPSSAWEWNKGMNKIQEYGRWMSGDRTRGFAYGKFTFKEQDQNVHVVIANHNEDLSWTKNLVYPFSVISRNGIPKEVFPNKGNEAGCYLEWIINNYDDLPDTTVFVHGHRNSWHNKFPPIDIYINNCSYIRSYKNINDEPLWLLSNFIGVPEIYAKYIPIIEKITKQQIHLNDILYKCCAQFYVKKHILLKYSKQQYIELYEWIMNNEPSDETARIFEYTFHIIFTGIHGDSG